MLMTRIGIQIEPLENSSGPELEAADRERDPQREADQEDGQRPDHVERAGDHRVDPAAEVAGEQAEDDGQDGGDQRRG